MSRLSPSQSKVRTHQRVPRLQKIIAFSISYQLQYSRSINFLMARNSNFGSMRLKLCKRHMFNVEITGTMCIGLVY